MSIANFKSSKRSSLILLISACLTFLLFATPSSAFAEDKAAIETLRQMSKAFTEMSEKAKPAVVWIKAEKTVTYYTPDWDWPFGEPFDPFGDDLFDRFFRGQRPRQRQPQRRYQQTAQGSGFIVSAEGHILTNNHLVGGVDKVAVKLADNREFTAEIVGADPESDVAVVKIKAENLPTPLELADSDKLEVGEWVLAIGNPFGLSHSVTAGIVSAKSRSGFGLTSYEDFIQTDAAINPGNSGGPLVNLDGKVVGISTFIISRSGGYMGIGFAIPINMAKNIYEQLVEKGEVVRGFLGIWYDELSDDLREALGLDKDTKGVAITKVIKDTAAEKAGLKHNDVILEFDGKQVESAEQFRKGVALLEPGTKVKLTVLRDGKRKNFTVELGKRPPVEQIAGAEPDTTEQLGFAVKNLTEELAQRLGYEGMSGVLVVSVESDSEAAKKGIKVGMLILEVNKEPVQNTKEFEEAVERAAKKGTILLLVTDGRYNQFIVLKMPEE